MTVKDLNFVEAAETLQAAYNIFAEADAALDAALEAAQAEADEVQSELEREREADQARIVELEALTADLPREKLRRLEQELEAVQEQQKRDRATFGASYTTKAKKQEIEAQIADLQQAAHDALTVEEQELAALRQKTYKPSAAAAIRLRQHADKVMEARRGVERALASLEEPATRLHRLVFKVTSQFTPEGRELSYHRLRTATDTARGFLDSLK